MNHYKYTPKNEKESDLIKSEFEIISNFRNEIVFSVSKIRLRDIKLGSLDGNLKDIKLKKIILNSESIIGNEIFDHISDKIESEIDKILIKKEKEKGNKDKFI